MATESGNVSPLAIHTYRWEGFVFNIVCAVYFLFFAEHIVEAADAAMRDHEARIPWLGVLLTCVCLAEVWAFPVKMRFINEAIRDNGDSAGRAFYLWMFHTVISVVLIFMIFGCFGVKITKGAAENLPWWMQIAFPVVVAKELVFLGFMWISPGEKSAPNPKYSRPKLREWFADAVLVVYACIAYSATWGAITKGMGIDRSHPASLILDVFLCSILFLIFYLPLRIPYWVEEMAQVNSRRDAARLVGSVLVVLVPVLISLYRANGGQ